MLFYMLYIRCPTCRTLLADKQLYYEKELAKICDDSVLTRIESDNKKEALINSLGLERYCCRMRILTYVKLIDLIK